MNEIDRDAVRATDSLKTPRPWSARSSASASWGAGPRFDPPTKPDIDIKVPICTSNSCRKLSRRRACAVPKTRQAGEDVRMSRIRVQGAVALLLCLSAWGPTALGAQDLVVVPASEELQEALSKEARVLGLPADAPAGDVIATAQGDYARLLAALYARGYLAAEISIRLAGREAAEVSALRAPRAVRPVRIEIRSGRAFRFGRAEVAPLPAGAAVTDAFAPGRVASTRAVRAAAADGVAAWRAASHAKARIAAQSLTARHGTAALDAVLRVDPGPALRFGRLTVPGDGVVPAARLRALAGLRRGAPYDPEALAAARDRLARTGAFSSVVVTEARTPNPDGTLDIALDVESAPSRRLGFGAEIESREGLSLEAFWLLRNVFDGAERLRLDLGIGGIGGGNGGVDETLGARLVIPGFRQADDTLETFTTFKDIDDQAFRSRLVDLGVRRERLFRERRILAGAGALFRFSGTDDAFGARGFRHLVLQIDATQDLRDDPLDPRNGRHDRLEARPFLGLEDGSGTGVRLLADFRRYLSLGDSTVLAGRLQLGSVLGANQSDTPPEILFFSGGGGSVRGHPFRSLGVATPAGTVGGRGLVGASFELRQDITRTFALVGFVDFGYVSDSGGLEDGERHAGAGLGLRYKTPVGPIRADVGFPVKGESEDGFGIFLGIGQAF